MPRVNTDAVRAFVAVTDEGRFQEAADELGISQQAVSKRIAALERLLGVALCTRGGRAVELTVDGRAFLPHARALLAAERRAVESVRPGRRAFRVDVIRRRIAPADLVQEFHRDHPDVELDVHTLDGTSAAVAALLRGEIDAAFCCVREPGALPDPIARVRVYDEPLHLLVGPRHRLAAEPDIALPELGGQRIWIPAIIPGSDWGAYYAAMAAEFAIDIDPTGPNFGIEHLLDVFAGSATVMTLVGDRTQIDWTVRHDLVRIPLRDPTPVYPHSLLWSAGNRHPGLAALRSHLRALMRSTGRPNTWVPEWARPGA